MQKQEYLSKLNNGSIYKTDHLMADSYNLGTFDPLTLTTKCGCVSITAMTGAGKTFLIRAFLSVVHKHYDKIYLISSTAKLQEVYEFIPHENIYETYNEEFLTNLMDRQASAVLQKMKEREDEEMELLKSKKADKKDKEKEKVIKLRVIDDKEVPKTKTKVDKVLVIMDDIIHDPEYQRSQVLKRIFTSGRHVSVSVWFLTQNFTSLKPLQRNNVMWAIAFDLDSKKEREKFSTSYLSATNARVGELLFDKVVKERPYQCIVVEVYKNGQPTEEKVKKYVADPNPKKFVVPKVVREIKPFFVGSQIASGTNAELPKLRTKMKS